MSINRKRKASSSGSKASRDTDLDSPRVQRPITPLVPTVQVPSPAGSSRVDAALPTLEHGPTEKTGFLFIIGRGNAGKTVCARLIAEADSGKFTRTAKKEGL